MKLLQLLTLVILSLVLFGCTQTVEQTNEAETSLNEDSQGTDEATSEVYEMPCHKMPDGTMMGDCDEGETGMDHMMHEVASEEEFVVVESLDKHC